MVTHRSIFYITKIRYNQKLIKQLVIDWRQNMYFEYGDDEITYLKNKDKKIAEVIEKLA